MQKTKKFLPIQGFVSFVEFIGNSFSKFILEIGEFILFCREAFKWWFKPPYRFGELIKHIEFVGNRSISIVCLTGLFTGLVFAFQAWIGLSIVNAENLVGPTAALGIFRELGPVLTGLIIAARAGGAMAARIGTMRVTEQIDALEVMGVNPVNYLVSPRIMASLIATPLMTAVFDFMAMAGSYFLCINVLGLDKAIFWDKTQYFLDPKDINEGLIKAAAFGLLFSTICTYRGFKTTGGASGVGDATNKGVVASMVAIIVIDFFITKSIRLVLKWL